MDWKTTIRKNLRQYMMLIVLFGIIIFFQILTNGILLKPMNVSNLIFQNAYVVILAVGMLLCILTGGNIDLSVGSVVAFVGACAGTFIITWGWNPHISILLCLLIGIAIGIWQGFWIAYVKIPAFIATLAGMLVFRGLTLIILRGLTLAPFPQGYLAYSTGYISDIFGDVHLFGVRNTTSLLLGILTALVYCIIEIYSYRSRKKKGYTVENPFALGIKLLVIGAAIIWLFYTRQLSWCPESLHHPRNHIDCIQLFNFLYSSGPTPLCHGGNRRPPAYLVSKQTGFFSSFMSIWLSWLPLPVLSFPPASILPLQAGQSFEMDAIAACFTGGASTTGGIGTVGGTLVGALIMGILNNGMSIMGISSNVQQVVKGLVLLAAVAFDVISKQNIRFTFLSKFRRKKRKEQK